MERNILTINNVQIRIPTVNCMLDPDSSLVFWATVLSDPNREVCIEDVGSLTYRQCDGTSLARCTYEGTWQCAIRTDRCPSVLSLGSLGRPVNELPEGSTKALLHLEDSCLFSLKSHRLCCPGGIFLRDESSEE